MYAVLFADLAGYYTLCARRMIRAESEHHLARIGSATPLLQPWSGQTLPCHNISIGLELHNRKSGQGESFCLYAGCMCFAPPSTILPKHISLCYQADACRHEINRGCRGVRGGVRGEDDQKEDTAPHT